MSKPSDVYSPGNEVLGLTSRAYKSCQGQFTQSIDMSRITFLLYLSHIWCCDIDIQIVRLNMAKRKNFCAREKLPRSRLYIGETLRTVPPVPCGGGKGYTRGLYAFDIASRINRAPRGHGTENELNGT